MTKIIQKTKVCLSLLTLTFIISATDVSYVFAQADGKKLFQQNCASCHKVLEDLTGPALKGIDSRRQKEWIYKWIHNSQEVVASGDDYAVQLFNKWNKTAMTSFPTMKNEEIDAILAYVKQEETAPPPSTTTASTGGASGEGVSDNGKLLGIILVVLIFVVLILARVSSSLDKIVKEKLGEPIPAPVPLGKQLRSKKILIPAFLVLFIFGGYKTYDAASNLGRQQGYMPDQPIKFSHKIHAGINQIDCKYCHSSAEKGKTAGIPSVNVCMNCHKAIKKGTITGEEEIKKIYAALESNKAIEWTKIHNLPDHVYFNHSQHVVAGGVECQTCHGQIQEMDVVKQDAPLSMGWCVNCHRDTEVKFKENGYYAMFERLHEEMKSGKIDKVTEAQLGGQDCQKCHY